MCGRYAITLPPEAVRAFFGYVEQPNFPPRLNIAPTQPIPIVTAKAHTQGGERHFQLVRWGLIPGFVKDPKDFPLLINARAEGVEAKPSFRNALKRRRCLVIADGFYEWRRVSEKGPKQPFLIRRIDGLPMGFAGLWETWSDPTGGEIDTACIITTAANRLMSMVHDRMPAMIEKADFSKWLDVDGVEAKAVLGLLAPAAESVLELVPLGPGVGRVANDGPEIQAAIGEAVRAKG